MWNSLKSLSNQLVYGHKGRHFSQVEIEIGARLLNIEDKNSPEYKGARELLNHLSDREVRILQGVALGKRNQRTVKEIMKANRL